MPVHNKKLQLCAIFFVNAPELSRNHPFSGKLPPAKLKNADVRPREYLTDKEFTRLMKAASKFGRHGHRDSTLILVTYRYGFRVSEIVALGWNQVELDGGRMHASRSRDGSPSVHSIRGPEIRAVRRLKRDYPESPHVFGTERKGPLTDSAVRKMIARAGRNADFDFPIHPHMLRHATGYKLANDGHDIRAIQQCLGHKNIQHTVCYTELAPNLPQDFWKIRRLGRIGKAQMAPYDSFASSGPIRLSLFGWKAAARCLGFGQ